VYNEELVRAPYPFGFVGDAITRCVVIALPSLKVRSILPLNLELQPQNATPPGTHPVVFLFHEFIHCQFSFPTGLPPMNFHEQTIGIPFTEVRAGRGVSNIEGSYYFLPKFYLDDLWVLLIGRSFWGFDKELAAVSITGSSYTVMNRSGRRLASLEWSSNEERQPAIDGYPEFEAVRQMLSQPLISFSPMGIGPILTLTDFVRNWNLGTVRRLRSIFDVDPDYLRGFGGGRFATESEPGEGVALVLGSYEISAQWWLSYPYLPPNPVFGQCTRREFKASHPESWRGQFR
jgi:hypothetical protein